jgi:phosphoglycolate phosphatase-like HAD superfamily hydrolase
MELIYSHMPRKPLLLFDLDGTLIRVEGSGVGLSHHVGRHAKMPVKEEMKRLATIHGVPSEALRGLDRMAHIWNACRAYAEGSGYTSEDASALMAAINGPFMAEERADHALSVLIPGVVEALETLTKTGYEMGLVTTASNASVERIGGSPEYGRIGRFFKHMVTRDDCLYVKPEPEPIIRALRLHGREDFVYIGDSDHDAEAAEAAHGAFILVNTRGYNEDQLKRLGPDAVISGLGELPNALSSLGYA